jgi:hypothetical protein
MDRRNFVRRAGFVAAGSALSGSVLGCAANEIYSDVPCLTLASTPVLPGGSMAYIKASEIGCALDCDLGTGLNKHTGGPATDDAPRINAAMAGATSGAPITLIIDGTALISGLFMPAGGYWGIQGEGCNSGFFIKPGTNNDGIHNGGPGAGTPADFGPSVPLPPRGSSVSLANFVLNCNRGNGLNGDSTSGVPQGGLLAWFVGINLMNLDNIVVENVVVLNAPSYHFRFSNTGNVAVSGCIMKSSGNYTDGLHFDGPANDITITGCDFTTGDDAIALNCPEGYSGNISRVAVSNCTFNSWTLMRLDTGVGPGGQDKIDSVTVTNCSGSMVVAAFLIGTYANNIPNAVLELSVSNCQISAPAVLDITTDFSTLNLSGVTFIPSGNPGPGYAFVRTFFVSSNTPYTGASLSLQDCAIQRHGDYSVPAISLEYGSTIENLEFNGFAVQDPAGSFYAAIPELLNIVKGQIGQLTIDGVTSAHIAGPVSAGGFSSIGSVRGAGVLGSGWQFPDAVMGNGSPYISANSQQPSIKVAGVVKSYP